MYQYRSIKTIYHKELNLVIFFVLRKFLPCYVYKHKLAVNNTIEMPLKPCIFSILPRLYNPHMSWVVIVTAG